MATAYTDQVQKVYIAYYGRAADPVGLAYWAAKVETDGLAGIMASFGASAEATTLYGSLTNTAKVNALFQQSFGRDADFAGLMYYAGQLTAGTMTAATIAQNIFDGASGSDATILANKLIVAKAYTTAIDTASEVVAYSGTVAAASARALLTTVDAATVTASFDVATSVANIVTVSNTTAAAAGQTYKLTTSTDNLTGGTGHDTFEASYTSANGMTLQSSDTITGGLGNDYLNVTIGAAGTHQASDLTGVETVKGTFSATGTLSLLGSAGVTHMKIGGSTAAATVTNIPGVASLEVENSASNATFTYKATDVSGAADSATLTLNNVTAGTVSVAGIETVNVVSGGGGNVLTGLTVAAANTVNITGSQSLNLGVANTTSELIDGSAATGALTIITNNANSSTVKTGSGKDKITSTGGTANVVTIDAGAGDDKVTFTAALGATDVLDGGAGTDTLVGIDANLTALTVPSTGALITNFETVEISDEYTNATVMSDIQVGITTINMTEADASTNIIAGALAVTGDAGSITLNLGGSIAGNISDLNGALTINDTGTGTTDSLTINNKSINLTGNVNVDLNDAITSAGYELVTLNTGTATGNVSQTLTTFTITPDAVTAPVSLTVTGGNSANFGTSITTTSTALLTIDGSGMDGQTAGVATLTIASTSQGVGGTATITGSGSDDAITIGNFASTIHGGAGTDTIIGGTKADTINGDAGNDILTGSGGNDIINGGLGNDTITAGVGNVTVTGGAGTDSVEFAGTLTQADSFDGGDGEDTLILNNASVTAVKNLSVSQINTLNAGVTNVEVLQFNADLAQSIDLGRLDGISKVQITGMAGDSVMSGLGATNHVEIQAATGQGLTLTLTDASGTDDSVNLVFRNSTASSAINANTITSANVETVNISSAFAVAGTDEAGDQNTLTLVATKAKTITVTGDEGIALTNSGNTKVTTFDASGVVATSALDTGANMAVTFLSANTSTLAKVAITGGAGNDTLTGNVGIDTIVGGAGDDSIVATAGNDVMTGGAGADTFGLSELLFIANSGTTATFDGGAGTDILNLTENAVINVVDADFRGITSVETFTTADGTNNIVFGVNADTTGIKTITGGTGADTFTISSVDFDNAVSIEGGLGADVITLAAGTDQKATVLVTARGNVNSNGLIVVDNGAAGNLDASDTLDVTSAADVITGFTVGTDKVDLSYAGITGVDAVIATSTATATDAVANSQYNLTYGTLSGTIVTLTAAGAATHTVLIYDSLAGASVDGEIMLLDGVLTATDLVLT